jgi:polysaccharide pyruvyl transferase WcaK-like protein
VNRLQCQALFPKPATWKELVALLRSAEYLIASRLHSSVLGFVAQVPVVAISFDAKVDRVMEDLGQTEALLQIASFDASGVLGALKMLESHREEALGKLSAYRLQALEASGRQYEALARIAIASRAQHRDPESQSLQ